MKFLSNPRYSDGTTSMVKIGYARCSTDKQDLTAQRQQLMQLGCDERRIYFDEGMTGRQRKNRHGLDLAIAACRDGDTLVVTKLDRLARSIPDAQAIASEVRASNAKLSLGGQIHDPNDAFGKMFFNILALFAEFEVDLLSQRTKEGMAIARDKGKLKGKPPKLKPPQREALLAMHRAGSHNVAELASIFSVSRPTVYRELRKADAK